MEYNLEKGLKAVSEVVVTKENSASSYGSGLIDVFATPAMVALMENASYKAVEDYLPEGYSTVGINVNVNHTKATKIGLKVMAEATLIEIDRKKLTFEVIGKDEEGVIGKGLHTRYIINKEKFMENL